MFCRSINQCIRILPYKINHFKIDIRHLSKIPPIKEKQNPEINSTIKDTKLTECKYPGYEIIYHYPFIKYVSLLHLSKRNLLITSIGIIPIIFCLHQFNIVSESFATILPIVASTFTISIVIIGQLFVNQIGIIYYKDKDSIKIAYVNQFGKRIDIDTKINEIKPLCGTPYSMKNKLFKNVHIASLKFPLKLYVDYSLIKDKDKLVSVLGDYE